MKTQFETELHALSGRDTLFLNFTNQLLANREALSGDGSMSFSSVDRFFEFKHSCRGNVDPIIALVGKIHNIIFEKGSPVSVVPFLKRVVNKGLKMQSQPSQEKYEHARCTYGLGHFRWDWKAYTLDNYDLDAIRMYLNMPITGSDAPMDESEGIDYKNFAITAHWAKAVTPPWDKTGIVNQFLVQVVNKANGSFVKFDFFGSIHDYREGKKILGESDLLHAFYCFVSDSECGSRDFEDFCSELGYDTDSRSAEKIHNACKEQLTKSESLGLSESLMYDLLNQLSEIC